MKNSGKNVPHHQWLSLDHDKKATQKSVVISDSVGFSLSGLHYMMFRYIHLLVVVTEITIIASIVITFS